MVGITTIGSIAYDVIARDRTQEGLETAAKRAKRIQRVGIAIGTAMTGVGVGAKLMADNLNESFMRLDTAMAGVRKTTGMSKAEIAAMRDEFIELSKEIPTSAANLANIGRVAGQLGITGKENILEFTKTVSEMAVSFDMAEEDAAIAMAKMTNVYGLQISEVKKLGSAINVLGNTTEAKEQDLMDFSASLGASAQMLGFTSSEALAMGATLVSMSKNASDSGTRLSRAFAQIASKTDDISRLLGMTKEEFERAFGDDPMAMLEQIVQAIANIEDPLRRDAVATELFDTTGKKAILGLAANFDQLRENLENAETGFREGTSLEEEYANATDTLAAKLGIANNRLEAARIELGGAMAPATLFAANAMSSFAGIIEKMPGPLQTTVGVGLKAGEVFMGLGPILMGLSAIYPVFSAAQMTAAAAGTTLTASIWASTAAFLASPLGLFVVGIAAVGGALVVLEKKFGVVTKTVDILSSGVHRLVGWFKDKLAPGIGLAQSFVEKFGDKLLFLLGPIGAVIFGLKKIHGWLKRDKEELDPASEATREFAAEIAELDEKSKKTSEGIGEAAAMLSRLTSAFNISDSGMADFKSSMESTYAPISEYESLLRDSKYATEELARVQDEIGASKDKVGELTSAYDELARAMKVLSGEAENVEDQERSIEHAQWAVKDAEEAYQEAVAKYGAKSDEALRADLRRRDAIDQLEDANKRLEDIEKQAGEARAERSRIFAEYNVSDLESLEAKLEAEKTKYEEWVNTETLLRQQLADTRAAIEEAEATKGIKEWNRMKDYMEENPISRKVITTYIEKGGHPGAKMPVPSAGKDEGEVPAVVTGEGKSSSSGKEERGAGSRAGGTTTKPPITIYEEYVIHNYSDMEMTQRSIGEAKERGVKDAWGLY